MWRNVLLLALTLAHVLPLARTNPVGGEAEVGQQLQRLAPNPMEQLRKWRLELPPEILNFKLFLIRFGKHYSNAAEFAARQSLFLARAFRSFISMVNYNSMRSISFKSVNSRSDWTPQEFESTLLPLDDEATARPKQPKLQDNFVAFRYLQSQLDEIRRRMNESGYKELAAELDRLEKSERSGKLDEQSSSGSEKTSSELVAQRRNFVEFPLSTSNWSIKLVDGSKGLKNHEDQTAGQLTDVGSTVVSNISPAPDSTTGRPLRSEQEFFNDPQHKIVQYAFVNEGDWREVLENNKNQPGQFMRQIFANFLSGFDDMFGPDATAAQQEVVHSKQQLPDTAEQKRGQTQRQQHSPDELSIDHRKSGCMSEVKEQGACGSCYAFAVLDYLEWAHCKETGSLERFSVQYLVDCGWQTGGLYGCSSGKITSVAEFVQNFGLELEQNYPYVAKENQCPYKLGSNFGSMGYLRVQLDQVWRVPLGYMEDYLGHTPMVVSLAVGRDFFEYGGGVDMGEGCGQTGRHTMLLVGQGKQDGRDYWLLKNSYSGNFGESGYYKLDKARGSRCFAPAEGFVYGHGSVRHPWGLQLQRNPNVGAPVSRVGQRNEELVEKQLEAKLSVEMDELRRLEMEAARERVRKQRRETGGNEPPT